MIGCRQLVAAGMAVLGLMVTACAPPSDGRPAHPSSSSPSTDPADPTPRRSQRVAVAQVRADSETQPTKHSGDSADDPAIWVNRKNPASSLIIGNDKRGALEVYDLSGSLVQRITTSTRFWGNVDVRQGVRLASGSVDVVAAVNAGVRVYSVNPGTRKLTPITPNGKALDTGGGEGLCLYSSLAGELSVFMVFISGAVRQFSLVDDGSGRLSLEPVRYFEVGSEAEGCVVDDQSGALYISEEDVGLWKYDADKSGGDYRTMVDPVWPKGHQAADIEGVTLVDDGQGEGLIITSSQGQYGQPSYFSNFDRQTGEYLSSFRVGNGRNADDCSHTDGITATGQPLGPNFPHGAFICQDDKNTLPSSSGNQNFKITRLEKIRPESS